MQRFFLVAKFSQCTILKSIIKSFFFFLNHAIWHNSTVFKITEIFLFSITIDFTNQQHNIRMYKTTSASLTCKRISNFPAYYVYLMLSSSMVKSQQNLRNFLPKFQLHFVYYTERREQEKNFIIIKFE